MPSVGMQFDGSIIYCGVAMVLRELLPLRAAICVCQVGGNITWIPPQPTLLFAKTAKSSGLASAARSIGRSSLQKLASLAKTGEFSLAFGGLR